MAKTAEREALKKKYGKKINNQEIDKMSDSQVIAIYLRLKAQGKL